MAGLLDILGSDTGLLGLQLMAAGSAKPVRTGFGEGLLGALQGVQAQRAAEEDRKARQQMQAMQMQQMQEAAAARKQAQEQQQQRMSYLGAIDSDQGPAMPLSVPRALSAGLSLPEIGALSPQKIDPMAGFDKVSPKDYTPESLAAFMQTRNPAVLRAAPKDQTPDEFERALRLAGIDPASPQGRQMATARAQKMATHQPATSLNVNMDNLGLKPKDRFEMEQKLGADFSTATKLDRGIVSTAQDITNILKQGGALKDQAAIYKFAKALDPEGAVREADYAAIVQTAGGLGYVQALFNKALTGEQLIPRQREEMINITQAMASVAQQRINSQKASLTRNARQYNLTPENLFAPTDVGQIQPVPTMQDSLARAAAEEKRRRALAKGGQ